MLTRTSRSFRTVRTVYAYQPPAKRACLRHRAAAVPRYVHRSRTSPGCAVPRTVALQAEREATEMEAERVAETARPEAETAEQSTSRPSARRHRQTAGRKGAHARSASTPQTNDERERNAAKSSTCGAADCGNEQWTPALVGSARALPTFLTLCSMIGEGTQTLGLSLSLSLSLSIPLSLRLSLSYPYPYPYPYP